MYFSVIFSRLDDDGFGSEKKLAFRNSFDLKWFSMITKSNSEGKENVLVMGKTTYLSLPSLPSLPGGTSNLPGRKLIVVSKTLQLPSTPFSSSAPPPAGNAVPIVASSLTEALSLAGKQQGVYIFVIGGVKLIEEALVNPGLERIYITSFKPNKPVVSDVFLRVKIPARFYLKSSFAFSEDSTTGVYETYENLNSRMSGEYQYFDLLNEVLGSGTIRVDRTGTGTVSAFSPSEIKFSLKDGSFPLLTTKRLFFRGVVGELLWFLTGKTNVAALREKGINIWSGNTSRASLDTVGLTEYPEGETGPLYGFQWRHFGAKYQLGKLNYTGEGVDQIANIVHLLKHDPFSRRIVLSAWNPVDLDKCCLSPCHVLCQFYVSTDKKYLSSKLYIRSNDLFLGAPWNIASYSLLTRILAHLTGYEVLELCYSIGDAHIYRNHVIQVKDQLTRSIRPFPVLEITGNPASIDDFTEENFTLRGYHPHPAIKASMAV